MFGHFAAYFSNAAAFFLTQTECETKRKKLRDNRSEWGGTAEIWGPEQVLNKEMEHRVKSHGGMKDVGPKTTGSDLCCTADTGPQEAGAQTQWVHQKLTRLKQHWEQKLCLRHQSLQYIICFSVFNFSLHAINPL